VSLQPLLFAEPGYTVQAIPTGDAKWLILNRHYARRMPSISYAFGLFRDGDLAGVITYGIPPSPNLMIGVAGAEWRDHVIELNRLVLVNNEPNEASRLIGGSLRQMRGPLIIVSYADTAQDHIGKVYQATNWLYTGMSDAHVEWRLDGIPTTSHDRHMWDSYGGIDNAKQQLGDRLQRHERSRKHRYIQLIGNRKEKRAMREALRYEIASYPKLEGN